MPFPDEAGPLTVDYQPEWQAEFQRRADQLAHALGDVAVAIDHVGSTAVPGLPAKDCVDVQVRVKAIDEATQIRLFSAIGFRCRSEPWNRREISAGQECRKLVFAPLIGDRRCNIHVREHGGANAPFRSVVPGLPARRRGNSRSMGCLQAAIGGEHFQSRFDRARAAGHLDGIGRLLADAARAMRDAVAGIVDTWCRATGQPGGHGHPGYRPPAAMQRLVQRRHATCVYPTCNRRSIHCDLDHTVPYDKEGRV